MSLLGLWAFGAGFGGCHAGTGAEAHPPAAGTDAPRPLPSASQSLPSGSEKTTAAPPASASASASASAASSACPADMVLVDGDYCTKLKLTCLKSWYAKSNRKTVCKEFAKPSRCVGDKVHKRFCMDRYEYANKPGARPVVWNNFYQAQVICADQGKRVCTETEWTMACEGPDYKPYPYGYKRNPKICNGDRPWDRPNGKLLWKRSKAESERLWQGVVSGSQPQCISDYGVYDMPGNADELAASESFGDGKFDNVTTGGPWYLGVRNQCRPKIYDHDESFAYYYLSFRCCKSADGKPTDPRSPKQRKRGWTFKRIREIAKRSLSLKPR